MELDEQRDLMCPHNYIEYDRGITIENEEFVIEIRYQCSECGERMSKTEEWVPEDE